MLDHTSQNPSKSIARKLWNSSGRMLQEGFSIIDMHVEHLFWNHVNWVPKTHNLVSLEELLACRSWTVLVLNNIQKLKRIVLSLA